MCTSTMVYTQIESTNKPAHLTDDKNTHVFICEDCPAVLFEYYHPHNVEDIKQHLNK